MHKSNWPLWNHASYINQVTWHLLLWCLQLLQIWSNIIRPNSLRRNMQKQVLTLSASPYTAQIYASFNNWDRLESNLQFSNTLASMHTVDLAESTPNLHPLLNCKTKISIPLSSFIKWWTSFHTLSTLKVNSQVHHHGISFSNDRGEYNTALELT